MNLKTMIGSRTYQFSSVKEVLAKASEQKSGDSLAKVGATEKVERVAAKEVLANLTVKDITENPVVPYESDAITRLILDDLDRETYDAVKEMPIGDLREWILANPDGGEILQVASLTSAL